MIIMFRQNFFLCLIFITLVLCDHKVEVTRRSNPRIVNGNNVNRGIYPAYAWIFYKNRFYCGGTIINKRTIVTAAQCANLPRETYTVAVGKYKTEKDEGAEQLFTVQGITTHEFYDYQNNDIALLHLNGSMNYTEVVQPATIAQTKRQEKNQLRCYAVGAGAPSKSKADVPRVLQHLKTTVVPSKKCNTILSHAKYATQFKVNDNEVCTYGENSGVCFGDSGGPVGCFDAQNRFVQIGLLSHASSSCADGVNVFTRLYKYKNWIRANK